MKHHHHPLATSPLCLVALLAACASTATSAGPAADLGPPPGAEPTEIGGQGDLAANERASNAAGSGGAAAAPQGGCTDLVGPNQIRRSAVKRVVDAGLGRWLGRVEVERQLDKGRFQGWRVVRLYPGDPCYAAVDVRPGDVVRSINGKSIEDPSAAHAVFASLADAPSLVVQLVRAGEPRTLTLAITAE